MSELQLRELGARAEELVVPPDFDGITRRGRQRHRRHQAMAGGVIACVLAVTGAVAVHERDSRPDVITPPPVSATPYPGATMEDLEPGTYELWPSPVIGHPGVRMTVPAGWNAWAGPNRFNGHSPGGSNGEALERMTWYVGLLVLAPTTVAAGPCTDGTAQERSASDLDVPGRAPGLEVTSAPETLTRFGHPAVHLQLGIARAKTRCHDDFFVHTLKTGVIGFPADGATVEVWVVDLDGDPILVVLSRWGSIPPAVARQLTDVLDSVTFVEP